MLEIKNLHARIAEDGTEIIRGLNLTVKAGEVAAIMGPNGSGKSTLSYILAGRPDYEVTEGDILYNGESILEMDAAERTGGSGKTCCGKSSYFRDLWRLSDVRL